MNGSGFRSTGKYHGPHSEVTSGDCEIHLGPTDTPVFSPQVAVALLPLSRYQNQHAFAAKHLVGDMFSRKLPNRKYKLKTELNAQDRGLWKNKQGFQAFALPLSCFWASKRLMKAAHRDILHQKRMTP